MFIEKQKENIMNIQDLIHKKTWKELQGYLAMSDPPGIILSGITGVGKYEIGLYIASKILGCPEKDLSKNPDFYITSSNNTVSSEDIKDLVEFSWRTSIKGKKVILINNAHTITVTTQNKLLKLLEDREDNILILLSDSNTLIPTIISRCCHIQIQPPDGDIMRRFLKQKKVEDSDINFMSYMVGNAPFLYAKEEETLMQYKKQLELIYSITVRSDLLKVMNMLKEKDRNNFYENHTSYTSWNIKLLVYPFYLYYSDSINRGINNTDRYPGNLYTTDEAYKIICMGQYHLKIKNYSKNDYFRLLRYVIIPED